MIVKWVSNEPRAPYVEVLPAGYLAAKPLPSGESAADLVEGKANALPRVLLHFAGRSALVGVGLALVGLRGKTLIKASLAGSAAIEAFVLAYAWWHKDKP